MIIVSTLFSGSSGNSTLIRSGNTAILIDAGWNCKNLCSSLDKLGFSLSDIDAVFVTHEHNDHISAIDVMSKKHKIPVHITEPSAAELCKKSGAANAAVVHDGIYYTVKVGELTVSSFPLPHDSAAHVGYTVVSDDGDRAGIATDMGYASKEAFEKLSGCRQIVVESNHDLEMLKYGAYPFLLKQRILSKRGHLSNIDSAEFCLSLAEAGCEKFMLAHLSFENNTPEKALEAVRTKLDDGGFSSVDVKVAPRMSPLTL